MRSAAAIALWPLPPSSLSSLPIIVVFISAVTVAIIVVAIVITVAVAAAANFSSAADFS
jgi:hypothetical protein